MNLGESTIDIKEVIAGSHTTITFNYKAGHPIDDGGYIKIALHGVSDFGKPQFENPEKPNYCRIATTGNCAISPRWDPRGHVRPWMAALYLQIKSGYLDEGEEVTVVFGDQSKGSDGWQVQTFCQDAFGFKTLIDPLGTYQFKELPSMPALKVLPGPANRKICIAPSQVSVNRPFEYYIKEEDVWGNPTQKPMIQKHSGYSQPGIQTISIPGHGSQETVQSNPIKVLKKAATNNFYWADFHAQSEETIGINSIERYFEFARDYALLDISGHQGNDFQVTDEFWEKINLTTKTYYKPGSFVTFPGYEWSGNTPLGGDRNVYYSKEGGVITRSSREQIPGEFSKYKDSPTALDLFKHLDGPDPFVFAHVGGRYANMKMHGPDVEVGMEIHSCWGTFEWLLNDALAEGYRVGICANSDDHHCRPGASYPGSGENFGSYGGLTCVLSERLNREEISAAMLKRHFYATTGNRSLLKVSMETENGTKAIMGDVAETRASSVTLSVFFAGTGPIDYMEIRNGSKPIELIHPALPQKRSKRFKIVWAGAENRGRNRMVFWKGGLSIQGNRLISAKAINGWKPNKPLVWHNDHQLSWDTVTTGGVSGVIIELENEQGGNIDIQTTQGNMKCEVDQLGLEKKSEMLGGLDKQLSVYRLPEEPHQGAVEREITINSLNPGDNPLYVYVEQEDGQMAWSSPIYVVKSDD